MTLEIWLAYVAACTLLLAVPGPTIMLVISNALSHGRSATWGSVLGVTLGDLTALVFSLAGMGALLKASAAGFMVLKYVGAAYLIYLGIKMWRTAPEPAAVPLEEPKADRSHRSILLHTFAVTALNPKGLVFFVAFLPQFVSHGSPVLPQLVLLGATFLVLGTVNATVYALLAGTAREAFSHPVMMQRINRLGASLLIAAGLITATLRRVG